MERSSRRVWDGCPQVFAVFDRNLTIATDDAFVEQFVRAAYGRSHFAFVDVPSRPIDRGKIVTFDHGFRIIFDGEDRAWPVPMPEPGESFLAAFYGSRELFRLSASRVESCWPVYGVAIALGQQAVLVLGPSGAGKTTLALALVALGAQLYGDECIFIDKRNGIVGGLARSLMIREPALDLLSFISGIRPACARSPFESLERGRLWYAVDPNEIYGRDVAAAPLTLGAVLLLENEKSDKPEMTALPKSIAAMMVAQRSHVKATALDDLARAARVLSGVACYRVHQGTPADTAALVMTTLANAA